MNYYLYICTNQINNACYIGTTNNIDKRFTSHKSKSKTGNFYLYRAIRKYGFENFTFEVSEIYSSNQEVKLVEIYWIARFKEFGIKLYNLTNGGEGALGWVPDENWRKKRSAHMSGKNNPMFGKRQSQKTKDKISDTKRCIRLLKIKNGQIKVYVKKGRQKSLETRLKLSKALSGQNNPMFGRTGDKHPMFGKKGINHPAYGRKHTIEELQKISAALKGKPKTQKHKNNISKGKMGQNMSILHHNYGKKMPLEIRMKISNSMKGKYKGKNSPNYGRHHSNDAKNLMAIRKSKIENYLDIKNTIINLYNNDMQPTQISQQLNIDYKLVRRICLRYGVRIKKQETNKITYEQAQEIRIERKTLKTKLTDIAIKYNVGITAISNIINYKTHKFPKSQ